jgi:hypothetical protein
MKRIARLISVLAFALAMAVPSFAGICPDVFISTDGGATWSQCDFNGGTIAPDNQSITCNYTCYI